MNGPSKDQVHQATPGLTKQPNENRGPTTDRKPPRQNKQQKPTPPVMVRQHDVADQVPPKDPNDPQNQSYPVPGPRLLPNNANLSHPVMGPRLLSRKDPPEIQKNTTNQNHPTASPQELLPCDQNHSPVNTVDLPLNNHVCYNRSISVSPTTRESHPVMGLQQLLPNKQGSLMPTPHPGTTQPPPQPRTAASERIHRTLLDSGLTEEEIDGVENWFSLECLENHVKSLISVTYPPGHPGPSQEPGKPDDLPNNYFTRAAWHAMTTMPTVMYIEPHNPFVAVSAINQDHYQNHTDISHVHEHEHDENTKAGSSRWPQPNNDT